MCECQKCGKIENESALNDWGQCELCADSLESLIDSVCAGVDVPAWEFEG